MDAIPYPAQPPEPTPTPTPYVAWPSPVPPPPNESRLDFTGWDFADDYAEGVVHYVRLYNEPSIVRPIMDGIVTILLIMVIFGGIRWTIWKLEKL